MLGRFPRSVSLIDFSRSFFLRALIVLGLLLHAYFPLTALAHSVAQVQTTKFFAPETVASLQFKVDNNLPVGFQVGDTVTYIIQFTPVSNNVVAPAGSLALRGMAGYVTDYIPPGAEVIAASIVTMDSSGNFNPISPQLPPGSNIGWGRRGQITFRAPFNVATYDPSGLCTAAGFTNNCNGRQTEHYADTGIFYSTDPRTAQFPALPSRILQSANGYIINPTGAAGTGASAQINAIIGQTVATTHNLWDADQANAFGTADADLAALPAPRSAVNVAINAGGFAGYGTIPFNAGSAVAGPQTGYQLDNTGQIGPWQRIAYAGSRIGNLALGPATAAGNSTTAVGGLPISIGYNLSAINPLPAGTNAVRWALGGLTVGTINYVRITLRITAPLPTQGLVNGSEVFGGDAGGTDLTYDNTWRYHVPSVADNNSNLYVRKIPCVYDPTATTCVPLVGNYIPANSTVTYQITYLNTGNANQNNVVLQDILPCFSAAGTQVRIGTATGPLVTPTALISPPYTVTVATAGNCTSSPQVRQTITFPTISLLGPGSGGKIILNVANNAATLNDVVVNSARMSSTDIPQGVLSNAVNFVGNNTTPAFGIAKTINVTTSTSGNTVLYTIGVVNSGTGPASAVQISDVLPAMNSSTVNPLTRFNYVSTSAIASTGLNTTTAVVISTNTAALFTPALTPYDTQSNAANSALVNWNFGAASSLAAGGRITISFVAQIGSQVNASALAYLNSAAVTGNNSNAVQIRSDATNVAGVLVQSQINVSKTLECYYVSGVCVAASPSGNIPPDSKLRYKIVYGNTGASAVSTVTLSDILPCQLRNGSNNNLVTITAVTGSITAASSPLVVADGVCPSTNQTAILGTVTSLPAGATGSLSVEMLLATPPTTTSFVTNVARLAAPTVTGVSPVTAQADNQVTRAASLQISKTASSAVASPGGTIAYTITITNSGTTAAQTITVYDWLPTGTATTADPTQRFSQTGTVFFGGSLTTVTTAINTPPTQNPYSAGANAANQQELVWNFGAQTLAVGASASITVIAYVGANLPPLPPPNYYYNNSKVTYYNGQQAASNAAGANVSLSAYLTITKTNALSAVPAGGTTNYTVTVSNFGPSAAGGAVIKDFASTGLSCSSVTCTAVTGGAVCPSAASLSSFFGAGTAIPTFPASSSLSFVVTCRVQATGQ